MAPTRKQRARLDEASWAQILSRDVGARFLFGVATTRIYCRPSCPSRRPRPENVLRFESVARAEEAGFRACRRCRPDEQRPPLAERAARLLQRSPREGRLEGVAKELQVAPAHLRREFHRQLGLTPGLFQASLKDASLRRRLRAGATVREAAHAAGIGSTGRLGERIGMRPASYRGGAAGEVLRYATADSPLGPVLVAASTRGVCAVRLGGAAAWLVAELQEEFPKATLVPDPDALAPALEESIRRASGKPPRADIALDLRGTAFQARVWHELRSIPHGTTLSYAQLAQRLGEPKATRAVASACGQNPAALLVPCHRVVGSDGALRGYRWGLERKRRLLEAERKQIREEP